MFETKSGLDVLGQSVYSADSTPGELHTGSNLQRPQKASFQPLSQNHKMDTIPLYAPGGFFIRNLTQIEAEAMRGVQLRRNKRGHITGCYLKPLTCHVVRYGDSPGYGEAFEQELASGRVYALRGVVGSR